jgi:hypothetical protein
VENCGAAAKHVEGVGIDIHFSKSVYILSRWHQIFKEATPFFSHSTPSLTTVIPAMDHIEALTNNSLDPKLNPSICAALRITNKTLNKYYNATDQSEIYCIAMGTCIFPPPALFFNYHLLSVLHPRHKLQYFKRAGWQPDWIKKAEEIVRAKFDESYAAPADDSDDVDMLPPASTKKVHYLLIYLKSHRLILIYL